MTRLDLGLAAVLVVAMLVGLMLTLANRHIPGYVEVIAYAMVGGLGVRQHHRVLPQRRNRT